MLPYTSRGEAKLRGLSQYFTGVPCKHGHTTYRYTSSGACSGCIKAANAYRGDESADQKRAAKAEMVQVRVRCYEADREHVAAAVWALAVMRWPFLTQGDVDPKLLPKDKTAGTGLYAFYCHEGDIAAVREIAAGSMKAHKVDVTSRRNEVLRQLEAAADADTAPEWRP